MARLTGLDRRIAEAVQAKVNKDAPKAYEALQDSGKKARRPFGSDPAKVRENMQRGAKCPCKCHHAAEYHHGDGPKCCPVAGVPHHVLTGRNRYVPRRGYPPDLDDLLFVEG